MKCQTTDCPILTIDNDSIALNRAALSTTIVTHITLLMFRFTIPTFKLVQLQKCAQVLMRNNFYSNGIDFIELTISKKPQSQC